MRLLSLQCDGGVSMTSQLLDEDIMHHRYAILSHTWGKDSDEVTFEDILEGSGRDKAGYDKIKFCGEQAARDGLQYFWVDTCCIKKSSDAELSEAINSMFRWYQGAARCYVYLPDVPRRVDMGDEPNSRSTWKLAFRKSRWFTRGWTLQELLAPEFVEFFSEEKERLGDKESLKQLLNDITGIPLDALQGYHLSRFPVNERMSWAAKRETKRKEDEAYSLLGIFNIHMPLIYGEGKENAFFRLKEEIEKRARTASLQHLIEGDSIRSHSTKEDEKPNADLVTNAHFHHSGDITRAQIDHLIDSLKDRDANLRRNQVVESFDGTFQWIYNDDIKRPWHSFMDWLKSDSDLFWIVGKAGSGKSTLVKFLLTDPRTLEGLMAWRPGAIILSGFLWNSGREMQRTLKGLLSSLICQLLELQTEVALKLLGAHPELCSKRSLSDWSTPGLKRTLLDVIGQNDDIFICVFLDGLDEIGPEDDVHELISFLETLKGHINVKVCVSSRPERPFQLSLATYPKLRLQDLTSSDIRQYITKFLEPLKHLLERNSYPDDAIPTLAKFIEGRASGVFLWVTLVLKTLRSGFTNGDDWSELLQRLELLPSTLQELYNQMWLRLNEDKPLYHQQAASYFRFILDGNRLKKVLYFPILPVMALAFNQSAVTAILESRSKVSDDELARLCLRTCNQLQVRCAGLLELRTPGGDTPDLDDIKSDIAAKGGIINGALERLLDIKIDFVHRTARDFLLDTGEGQSILKCEEITLEDQALRDLRAAAAASVIMRNVPRIGRYVPSIECFMEGLNVLLPSMSRTEESYKNWERLLLNFQDLFDHNILLPCSCYDFLGLAASYGFHVFVEASLKKLDPSSGITATYVNYILCNASGLKCWHRGDFYSEDRDFRSSVIRHAIYRNSALVDWLLAYGADPNVRLGSSTRRLWKETAFMRFLYDVRIKNIGHLGNNRDRKPLCQWILSTMKRFLESGANLGSLAYSLWCDGFEDRIDELSVLCDDCGVKLLLEMNSAYLIHETVAHIKRFEPHLDVSWHEESILSTPKIKRPVMLCRCIVSRGRTHRIATVKELRFRTIVTLHEEQSKALATILEMLTDTNIKELHQQLEAMWQRGEELDFYQYMEQRGMLPPSSQKGSYPPTPTGEPSVKRVTAWDIRKSGPINASYSPLPWFRE